MNLLEQELLWEHDLFHSINGSSSTLMDAIMWLFSGSLMWIPIAVFFIFSIAYKRKWTEWLPLLLAIGLVILFCDQFSSGFCKPYFARLRPTHHPLFMDEVNTLFNYRGGRHGFISSHASNFFGFAMLTAHIFKHRLYSIIIFIWAFMVAYSRVYLGVHFISDVIAGALVGMLIGYLTYKLYKLILIHAPKKMMEPVSVSKHSVRNIAVVLILNTFLFSAFSMDIVKFLEE